MSANHEHVLPRRVLIVDDDELVRDTIGTLLRPGGFEVLAASDGAQALALLSRQWFPVVVTDRNMPGLDGIEFTARLRALASAPTYVIMLSGSDDARDYERGYCAGVDHYLSKQGYEKELLIKVTGGVSAIRRRRATLIGRNDGPVTVDLEGGSHTARHLVGRLCAEMTEASSKEQALHVLTVAIEAVGPVGTQLLGGTASEALFQAAYDAARPKLDWITRLPAGSRASRLAVIMPQSTAGDVGMVTQAIRNAFVRGARVGRSEVKLSTGSAQFTSQRSGLTALELLGESERNRRTPDEVAAKGEAASSAAAPPPEAVNPAAA
jgi:CheY-like chemotaxis protein